MDPARHGRACHHPQPYLCLIMNSSTAHPAGPTDAQRPRITPWRETLRQLLRSAQPHSRALARALGMMLAAAALHGLALACIITLFQALLPPSAGMPASWHPDWQGALPWLVLISLLTLAVQTLRWLAQGFDYHGQQADAVHHLRDQRVQRLDGGDDFRRGVGMAGDADEGGEEDVFHVWSPVLLFQVKSLRGTPGRLCLAQQDTLLATG